MAISITFTATPVLAPDVIIEPGGTTIEVDQGQDFVVSFRLEWDEPDVGSYYVIGLSWTSPRVDNAGTPSENFTFVDASASFVTGDHIGESIDAPLDEAASNLVGAEDPEDENLWMYSIVIGNPTGDSRNGEFIVDIRFSATGTGGVPHIPTENHPMRLVDTIDVWETTKYSYGPPDPVITIKVLPWTAGFIARGKENAYSLDSTGYGDPPAMYVYSMGENAPIVAAQRVSTGAVIALGLSANLWDGRWNRGTNPHKDFDDFLDVAFQWGKDGAENILWYTGYGVVVMWREDGHSMAYMRANDIQDNLRLLGYTLWEDNIEPITAGLLNNVDILLISSLQLGDRNSGGDPTLLPDADVAAIKSWVEAGGVLAIFNNYDTAGYNFYKVHNKILAALGFGWAFQSDTILDTVDYYGDSSYPILAIDTTTPIGMTYQSRTGTDNLGVYNATSLVEWLTLGIDVSIAPAESSATAGEDVTFVATVTNTGTANDVYTLDLSDDSGWPDLTFLPVVATTPLDPTDVTYVYENLPDDNFVDDYQVFAGADENGRYRTFLKFDLSEIPAGAVILNADLQVYARDIWDTAEDLTISVRRVDDDAWLENEVTWNTQPAYGDILDVKEIPFDVYKQDYYYDITSFVQSEFAGDVAASFCLRSENEDTILGRLRSYDYKIKLVVTYEAVPPYPFLLTSITVPLYAGDNITVDLGVTIDPDAPFCTRDTLTLTATSAQDSAVVGSDTAQAHSMGPLITLRGVTVVIDPENQSGWSALTYRVTVTNTGELDDRYVLTVSDTEDWGLQVMPSELWIAAGDFDNFDIASLSVTIPSDAIGGTEDTVTVTATGTMATGTGEDTDNAGGFDTTIARAEEIYGVDVEVLPSQSQTGAPEDNLVWVVKVRNIGNKPDTYSLSVVDTASWSPMLDDNVLTLAVGELASTRLRATVPSDAKTCTWNTLTVTASSLNASDNDDCKAHVLVPGRLIPQGTIGLTVEAEIIAIELDRTSWDFKVMDEAETKETSDNYFTVRNVGNKPVNISIKGSDAQSRPGEPVTTWTLWDSIGVDRYTMEFEIPEDNWTWLASAGAPETLSENLAPGAEDSFDLKITAPSTMTVPAKMWTLVTLTAVEAAP